MAPYRPALMNHWGEIDRNFFVSEKDRLVFAEKDCDANSISGDPMFVNPETGDFSVGESSPFLKHGFKNFPMDSFGVKKPDLKTLARQPVFPIPILENQNSDDTITVIQKWMGAEVAELKGEEFSAFGIKREDGGIHILEVVAGSYAAKAGFREGDLIQRVNGGLVRSVKGLLQATSNSPGKKMKIRFVRNYKNQVIEIEGN
jgi:membrane-associated protease RseP (regulator of RpoE activity)